MQPEAYLSHHTSAPFLGGSIIPFSNNHDDRRSPKGRVVGPLPNGRNLWLINRGDPSSQPFISSLFPSSFIPPRRGKKKHKLTPSSSTNASSSSTRRKTEVVSLQVTKRKKSSSSGPTHNPLQCPQRFIQVWWEVPAGFVSAGRPRGCDFYLLKGTFYSVVSDRVIWVFPKNRGTQKKMFIMENPIKMDDSGVPLLSETSICSKTY